MFTSALAFCTGGAGVALYLGEENFQTTTQIAYCDDEKRPPNLAWSAEEKRRQEALRRRQQQQNSFGGAGGGNNSHRGKPNDKVKTKSTDSWDELTEHSLFFLR